MLIVCRSALKPSELVCPRFDQQRHDTTAVSCSCRREGMNVAQAENERSRPKRRRNTLPAIDGNTSLLFNSRTSCAAPCSHRRYWPATAPARPARPPCAPRRRQVPRCPRRRGAPGARRARQRPRRALRRVPVIMTGVRGCVGMCGLGSAHAPNQQYHTVQQGHATRQNTGRAAPARGMSTSRTCVSACSTLVSSERHDAPNACICASIRASSSPVSSACEPCHDVRLYNCNLIPLHSS